MLVTNCNSCGKFTTMVYCEKCLTGMALTEEEYNEQHKSCLNCENREGCPNDETKVMMCDSWKNDFQ